MNIERDEVCIFIPTLNEAPTIAELIGEFKERGFRHILVMDGHSTDGTPDIARAAGAVVRTQTGRGKGNAIIEAVAIIDKPYVLMLDGDGTYAPDDAERMLDPLGLGFDHVIGDRLAGPEGEAFTRLNLLGNQILNLMFKLAHGRDLHDILSGYRAFTLPSIRQMTLKESGFEIETEMAVEAVRHGQRITVVPVRYLARPGTATKLNPLQDGARIFSTIYRLAKMNNPIFYFGIIGLFISLAGGVIGVYVVLEWLRNIEHLPLTILTVLLITIGFQIFMFGVISDMLLGFHRETTRQIEQLQGASKPPR
ncbi:MAG TPA: S-layer glycoprotein N-glycosyltransferase AglJ [Methanoculleus sp.]|jgi:dolichol-phosphate mannosyltransferase|uniref:S-layer glycoprotein N-glycosyltransferase AglJ n=1 Tax=Methanoculleus sp. TaxID=90427 RepID=UPI000A711CE4|nr:S-layer glycoprotein N-glycosyltransferase AglJ [Methanoculleus sp.]HNV39069.1 S-layer glycoprotein N-glycosyltransferase AglJ [Methanoculleus sp.]HOC84642.1 S-layer glycoprotein N-glycosyltransferase AglJ [Methanoculleus sp.]HOF97329.1 S-layer glycoprotein N-glycosyltransferase AglJ [Methanoculleus sp.]HOS68024.1 S-layer glycoprotein N-glycosyltransferase AglJ [Methanoculleus sp.]HOZ43643.1 S-layer glycoprotein N-glycosyltransferase AglJ [Methanoculleus sp.]